MVLTLLLALGALLALVTVLAVVVAMPATSATLEASDRSWLVALRWPVLVGMGGGGLTVLYAVGGPQRAWRIGAFGTVGFGDGDDEQPLPVALRARRFEAGA